MTGIIKKASDRNVVIVDGMYENPDEVRNFATKQEFVRNNEQYKVQRTKGRYLFPGVKEHFQQLLGKKITKWEEHGFNGCFQLSVAGDQIVYHSDAQTYAAVVYLTPDAPPQSGTALLRSKLTKGRTPDESSRMRGLPMALAQRQMYEGKLFDPTAWETVDVIGNVYNRLAIWNARLVHAGQNYFGHNLETGRLVQMFFFDAE